jgi:hypothetical protein
MLPKLPRQLKYLNCWYLCINLKYKSKGGSKREKMTQKITGGSVLNKSTYISKPKSTYTRKHKST